MTVSDAFAKRSARLRDAVAASLQPGTDAAVPWILALFVIAWTAFNTISYSSIGLNVDLTEIYSWSLHPRGGYFKHPPLGPLMAAAWFTVFPTADWSYHLLAITNAAVGLAFTDLIARRYLDADKRIFVLLFLMLTPFYQFHGQRFGSNQTMLSTWPLATYCFLRAFESRALVWSVAAGGAAGLAMLGRYYSIFLVVAFPIAALLHPARFRYLRSASPWLSVLFGFVALAPHLHWLTTNGPQTLQYAFGLHPATNQLRAVVVYLIEAAGYVALPCVIYALATRPKPAIIREALWPTDPDRRMLVVLLAVPLLLPPIVLSFLQVDITPLWTLSAWYLLPIVLLAPKPIALRRDALVTTAIGLLIFTAVLIAIAPALAWKYHRWGADTYRGYTPELAERLTRTWHDRFDRPLTIAMGDWALTTATSFYSSDHPDAAPGLSTELAPWVTAERMQREGFAVLCPAEPPEFCVKPAQQMLARYPAMQRIDVPLNNVFFGDAALPAQFTVFLIPPVAAGAGK